MPNYKNTVWKEVELTSHEYALSRYDEYTPEELFRITSSLIEKAKEFGLEGCYLKFESTRDPYEDYLGPSCVTPCGYRKWTDGELKEMKRQEAISKKASDIGITFHEASVLMSLQERGIIK